MKVYELKARINAFDNYYHDDFVNQWNISTDYLEVISLCYQMLMHDKAEGNY